MLQALAPLIERHHLSALLIFNPVNIQYLTDFRHAKGVLIFLEGRWILLTDPVHSREAAENLLEIEIVEVETSLVQSLKNLVPTNTLHRIGIEAQHCSTALFRELQQTVFDTEWVLLSGEIERLRMIKRPDEIDQLRANLRIALDAFRIVSDQIHAGLMERDLAVELEYQMRRGGAEGIAFETIVASGERSSYPHGRASRRTIEGGEPVLFDFGLVRGGYLTDVSRTVWVGDPPLEQARLYAHLLEIEEELLHHLVPGVRCGEVDRVWRECLAREGITDPCPHAIGHGLGMEIHEAPFIMRGGPEKLEEGMVITLEPGIYRYGSFGLRVEDMALITANGGVWLKDLPSSE